ncbi:Gamma-crystallin N, partial [Lemmus lemmus]
GLHWLFQITLYEGKHFTGQKLEVFGDCDNFQDRGFMNRVNSIRVESGAWVCFDHPDFRGQQFILEHGDYPEFFRWVTGQRASIPESLPPLSVTGARLLIAPLQHQATDAYRSEELGQRGGTWETCPSGSCPLIRPSLAFRWVLYEEPNYRGRMYVVERGDFRSFSDWEAQSARVQSLRRVLNFF